jgi:hypothetical protein
MGKRGPKPKKGATLGVRITTDIRKKLDAAAKHNGRSLSEEVETRLLYSFDADPGERATDRALLKLIGMALEETDKFTAKSWARDPYTFELAEEVTRWLIKNFRPPGAVTIPPNILPVRHLKGAPGAAEETLERLAKYKPAVFADAIWPLMIYRLKEAAAGGDRPDLQPLRDAANYLEGMLVEHRQDVSGNPIDSHGSAT